MPTNSFIKINFLSFFDINLQADKIAHSIEFIWICIVVESVWYKLKLNWIKITSIMLYGIMLEGLQFLVESRHPSINDIIANGFGIIFYALAIPLWKITPIIKLRWIIPTKNASFSYSVK